MGSWISRQLCQYLLDVGESLFVLSCAQSYGDRDPAEIRIVSELQGALDCLARSGMIVLEGAERGYLGEELGLVKPGCRAGIEEPQEGLFAGGVVRQLKQAFRPQFEQLLAFFPGIACRFS